MIVEAPSLFDAAQQAIVDKKWVLRVDGSTWNCPMPHYRETT